MIERGGDTRPTVLLHGGLSEASEWTPLVGRLPGRLIVPDRPGCGLTYKLEYLKTSFRSGTPAWMNELTQHIGGPVDIVANSLGGFFALIHALEHPERVRRLVLVGAPAGLHRELPLFIRLWGNPVFGQVISRLKITDPEVFRSRVVGSLLAVHPERLDSDLLKVMVAAASLPGAARSAFTMLRAVTTLRGWPRDLSLRDSLDRLTTETVFLWGERDAFAPPSRGMDVAQRMPHAQFEVVPDAGHIPHFDQPEIVVDGFRRALAA